MDLDHMSSEEPCRARLSDGVDPKTHEVITTGLEELCQAMSPTVSTNVKHMHGRSRERIHESRIAAFGQRSAVRTSGLIETLRQYQALEINKSSRIAIKAKGRILFIATGDVIAVEAMGNHILLLQTSGSHTLRETISAMETKLSRHGFVRIHRSVLVNTALVDEIQPCSTGEYLLRVRGGKEYTVTRTYKKNLQLLAQLWIGTDGFDDE